MLAPSIEFKNFEERIAILNCINYYRNQSQKYLVESYINHGEKYSLRKMDAIFTVIPLPFCLLCHLFLRRDLPRLSLIRAKGSDF